MERRVLHHSLMLACLLCVAIPAFAAGAPGPGLYLRAQAGFAWPMLDDVNSSIRVEQSALSTVSVGLDWEELAGGGLLAGELGYQFVPSFSLGIGLAYQKTVRDQFANILFDSGTAITSGRVTRAVEASLLSVMLTPTLWVPSAPGLHFGAQLGLGRGAYGFTEDDDLASTDGTFLVGTFDEEYSQTAFTAAVFAGFDMPLSPALAITMRLGYLIGNFPDMEGTFTSSGVTEAGPFFDSGSGPITDSAGDPLEVSFNGVNLGVGLAWRFGSGR
jgi:hypothetical protein